MSIRYHVSLLHESNRTDYSNMLGYYGRKSNVTESMLEYRALATLVWQIYLLLGKEADVLIGLNSKKTTSTTAKLLVQRPFTCGLASQINLNCTKYLYHLAG